MNRNQILRAAAFVFLIALGARLAFLAWQGPALAPDSAEYITLARNLSEHGVFSLNTTPPLSPSVRRAPLYPAFLAVLNLSGGISPTVVAIIQSFIDAGVAIIILLLALNIVPLRWAITAAIAYALHPGAISMTPSLLSETIYTGLLAVAVGLLVLAVSRNLLLPTILSGVAIGLAILCRTTAILQPLIFAGLLVVNRRFARRGVHAALLLASVVLVVGPWTIRTSRLCGRFVPVQAAGALNLYAATRWDVDQKNEAELARIIGEDFKHFPEVAGGKGMQDGMTQPEWVATAEKIWVAHALQNIRANPSKYLASRARTFPYLVLSSFDHFTGINESFGSLLARRRIVALVAKMALLTVFCLIPFLLGIAGLRLVRKNFTAALCAGVWVSTLLFHLPLWIEYRFWLPAVPFQLIGAIGGAYWIWSRLGAKRGVARAKKRGDDEIPSAWSLLKKSRSWRTKVQI